MSFNSTCNDAPTKAQLPLGDFEGIIGNDIVSLVRGYESA